MGTGEVGPRHALRRVLLVLALAPALLASCATAPASSGGSPGGTSPGPSGWIGPVPLDIFAGSFDDLPYRLTLPAGWGIGTPAQAAAYWDWLSQQPDISEGLVAEAASSKWPTVLIAYDGTEGDNRNPSLTCTSLSRRSIPSSEALDLGERQNLEGIAQSQGLVGEPLADRVDLPLGEAVRIRWRQGAFLGSDITSIGYLFVAGPTVITCVFRGPTDSIKSREPTWESILDTFEAPARWSVTETISVGVKPFHITSGGGAIFVANADSGDLSRIDPTTNQVTSLELRSDRSNGANEAPFDIAFDGARLWVTLLVVDDKGDSLEGLVLALDPATGEIMGSAQVGKEPLGLAIGLDSAWVASLADGTVSRVDRTTLEVAATITVGSAPVAVAVTDGAVWVANSGDGTVARLDPATNRVAATIDVAPELSSIAVGERGIWVGASDGLHLVDPVTAKVAMSLELAGIAGLVTRGGKVWAAETLGNLVHEIDEATATVVESTPLGTNSYGITELDGTLWVVQPAAADKKFAEFAPGTVTRLDR